MKAYHVTPRTNLHSIFENGLIPQVGEYSKKMNEETTAVWLFPSLADAKEMKSVWLEGFYGPDLVTLEIELPDEYPLGYTGSDYEMFTVKELPPEWIKVVDE